MRRQVLIAAGLVVAAGIGVALFALGRATAPSPVPQHSRTSAGDYFDGLRVGEAQGRREGRVLQEGKELPKHDRRPVRHAFNAGYAAGANDAFAGYDGGWALHVPWIVTLEGGSGQIAYRIKDREQVEPGIDYYLCADRRSLCQQRR